MARHVFVWKKRKLLKRSLHLSFCLIVGFGYCSHAVTVE